jgi:hypothetical protein
MDLKGISFVVLQSALTFLCLVSIIQSGKRDAIILVLMQVLSGDTEISSQTSPYILKCGNLGWLSNHFGNLWEASSSGPCFLDQENAFCDDMMGRFWSLQSPITG